MSRFGSLYKALALVVALQAGALAQSACAPPPSPAVQVNVLRAMVEAEASFNAAVTSERQAKASGLLSGAPANKADAMIVDAYAALLVARKAEQAGLSPNLVTLTSLITQIVEMTPKKGR